MSQAYRNPGRDDGRPDISEIAADLRADAAKLAEELLPAGRLSQNRSEWCCGSFSGEPGQSLRVCLRGNKQGLWYEHAAGEGGDMLDLVARIHFGGHRGKALEWARRWLGLDDRPGAAVPPDWAETRRRRRAEAEAARARQDVQDRARREKSKAWGQAAWLGARPNIANTPAAAYLAGRGIHLERLGRQPRALRYHPALTTEGQQWPAMVACIVGTIGDERGQIIGAHRTFLGRYPLSDGGGGWTKADMEEQKKVLGAKQGGLIPIWRGRSNKPLREAPPDDVAVLTEGIEDALTVAMAWPEARVICALDVVNIGAIQLPPALRDLMIYADNDPPGSDGAESLARVGQVLLRQGRRVRIARIEGAKDVNGYLMEGPKHDGQPDDPDGEAS